MEGSMADEGTAAVLDAPGTAATEPSLPVVDETPPDSEAPESSEIDTSIDDEQAPDSDTDEPRTFTQEEVEAKVRETEARIEESNRRKQETAQKEYEAKTRADAFTQRLTAAETNLTGGLYRAVSQQMAGWQQAAKQAWDEGKDAPPLPAQWFAQLLGGASRNAFDHQNAALHEAFVADVAEFNPEWKPTREVVQFLEQARDQNDPLLINKARVAYMREAVMAELSPKLRAQVEAELADSNSAAQQVAKTKDADARNKATTPRPTQVAGGGGRGISSMADADRAYNAKEINHDQYKSYRQKYGVS